MKFYLIILLLLSSQAWAKWSVSTYNIRNFDRDHQAGATNTTELEKIIKSVKSDVMVFEEVVNASAFKLLMSKSLPDYLFHISGCGGFGKQHLAIAFNPKVFKFINTAEDLSFSGSSSGSCGSLRPVFFINLQHKMSNEFYVFGGVHLKAGGDERAFSQRWAQYKKLTDLSKNTKNKNLILLGDFNTTGYNIKNDDYTKFESFLNDSSMRTMSENLGCTSYWEGTLGGAEHQSSILDHIVLQDKMVGSVQDIKLSSHCAQLACKPATPDQLGVSYKTVSDHCPIQVTFK